MLLTNGRQGAGPDEVLRPHLEAAERGAVRHLVMQRKGKVGVHVLLFRTPEAPEAIELIRREIQRVLLES